MKKLFSLVVLLSVQCAQAYTWTVKNTTDKKIKVTLVTSLVGANKQTKDISPKSEAKFKFTGWQAGACLSSIIIAEGGKTRLAYDVGIIQFCRSYTFDVKYDAKKEWFIPQLQN